MEHVAGFLHLSAHGPGTDLAGYLASSLVLLTFTMTSMRCLRLAAITSNIAFITYAILANLPPILVLHGILLPLNLFRLYQIKSKTYRDVAQRVRSTQGQDPQWVRTEPQNWSL